MVLAVAAQAVHASSASAAVSPSVYGADGHAIHARSCGSPSAGIRHLGWAPEKMWSEYSTVIVFRPEKLIAW